MTLKFAYTRRDNGAKVAKVAITFIVDREDVRRAVWTVLGERLEDDYGYRDKDDYLTFGQIPRTAAKITRAAIERQLRSDLESYGTVMQNSGDYTYGSAYLWQTYDADDVTRAAIEVVDATVDRLFPELEA